jgi:hypothetical protein
MTKINLVEATHKTWRDTAVDASQDSLLNSLNLDPCQLAIQQAKRWELETTLNPSGSKFALIIPIHNEEKSLPSFLSSLMLSDIT